jgi:hypothetical protein
MRSLATLWLALVGAISLAPRTSISLVDERGTRLGQFVAQVRAAAPAADASVVAARVASSPEAAMPASRVVAGARVDRPHASGTPDAPSAVGPAMSRPVLEGASRDLALRRLGAFSHAVRSRGGVTHYFSTAPPLQA